MIPLGHFKKMFPHKTSSNSTLTKDALLPTEKTWIGHDGYSLQGSTSMKVGIDS